METAMKNDLPSVDPDAIPLKLPRRPAFPPQVLVVVAFGLAVLGWDSTVDLGYQLFGPSRPIELGEPGQYRMDAAEDGAFVKVSGLLGGQRARYVESGTRYIVEPMLGTAVLVRRVDEGKQLPADVVERHEALGRLVRLDDEPSNVFVRMVRPAARYTRMRHKFDTSLAAGRDAFLLLDGDVPRGRAAPILLPLAIWAAIVGVLIYAARSVKRRREYDETMRRLRKMI